LNAAALNDSEVGADHYDVAVDALAGIGLSGPARESFVELIRMVNTSSVPVLSLDVPSGVDADTGSVMGGAILASTTVTFISHKPGLLTGSALNHVGQLMLAGLGAPPAVFDSVPADGSRIEASAALGLPARPSTAHKGHFGHVLVIGGNRGMGGASLLAAGAALRSGAGLVSLATRSEHVTAALTRHPELMVTGLDDAAMLPDLCAGKSVIVIGPGLGQDDWAEQCLRHAFSAGVPVICDADALNVIAAKEVTIPPGIPLIVTPHPGEASRLAGVTTSEIESDRVTWARRLAERAAAVVVLKGAGTVIALPSEEGALYVCAGGNPGMATGGMGDVLAGLIGALVAQGLTMTEASTLGVAIHARAGDQAWERFGVGLTASDVADALGVALSLEAISA
jgi:NAD(P)H-hydrate epimerase